MIPYFSIQQFHFGFFTIHVWGLFVALGIFVSTFVAARFVKERGLNKEVIWDVSFWMLLSGLIGSRIFHLFYEPSFYFSNLLTIFRIQDGGLSIVGGYVGAMVGIWLYAKKKKIHITPYVNEMICAFPLGIAIGRIGCFLIHDHPGIKSNLFFAVNFVDGARLDHGLILSIYGFFLFFFFLKLRKHPFWNSHYLVLFLLIDGSFRFFLDFFRATDGLIVDTRYFYLTIAQYVSLGMVLVGLRGWFALRSFSEEGKR